MPIQILGFGGNAVEVDGTTYRAMRVTIRPTDYNGLGHYRFSVQIPLVVTQAANGTLLSFRWSDATRFAVVSYLRLEFQQTSATATAAILDERFQAFIARGFTVSDSIGTAIVLTGNNQKKRTSMGASLIADARVSSVAAGLTVGTRTLDALPFLEMQTHILAAAPTASTYTVYRKESDWTNGQDCPVILAQNEGIIVRGPTTVFGAAGTANLLVEMGWSELTAY